MSRLGTNRGQAIERPFFFYVIGVDRSGPVKVGISSHMARRLIQLQTGNPHKLKIFYQQQCDSFSDADAIESAVLGRFRKSALCGEWLDLCLDDVLEWLKAAGLDTL